MNIAYRIQSILKFITISEYLEPKTKRVFLQENMDLVSEIMDPDLVIAELWSLGALSQEQYEIANCLQPKIMRSKYLLGLAREGPKHLESLRTALERTQQKELANKLR